MGVRRSLPAAVAAVATMLTLTQCTVVIDNDGVKVGGPSTPDPSPTVPEYSLDRLPAGDPPRVPWLESGTIHTGRGLIEVGWDVRMFATVPAGTVLLGCDRTEAGAVGKNCAVSLVHGNGSRQVLDRGAIYEVRTSTDRTRMAWARWNGGRDYDLVLADARTGKVLSTEHLDTKSLTVVGFAGDRLLIHAGDDQNWLWDPKTREREPLDGFLSALSVNPAGDRAAVITESREPADPLDPMTACGGVVSLGTNRVVWKSCDYSPRQISPDGAYALASRSDAVSTNRPLALLDARTGKPLAELDSTADAMFWESGGTLLLEDWVSGSQRLVRCTVPELRCEVAAKLLKPRRVGKAWLDPYRLPSML